MASGPREYGDEPRLVKLRLPARLVREMDRSIASSRGAYLDRNEFVAEAIWDRLVEEGLTREDMAEMPSTEDDSPRSPSSSTTKESQVRPPTWGRWRALTVPTIGAKSKGGVSFGLHNRDLPSLWVLDELAARTASETTPVAWQDFVDAMRSAALLVGNWYREQDKSAASALKLAVGFPRPGDKLRASQDRFVSASIGSSRGEGPLFDLGLAEIDPVTSGLLPTSEGLSVLRDLIEQGLGQTLPHPVPSYARWMSHLAAIAPNEHQVWLKVLKIVAEEPSRSDLTAQFPEWQGSQADTNCMGLVARSREWALIAPNMKDGRYILTEHGQTLLAQEGAV